MTVDVDHAVEGPEEAPALVLSNSLGTTRGMWEAQAAALSRSFRVVRYDSRGHGDSPVPKGPYSIADLGGDVVALLDRLGIERASFCGLSIGGTTGIWLGVNAADRIERLVLCCTAAELGPRQQWIERAALVRVDGTAPLADATMDRWFTPEFQEAQPEQVRTMRAALIATPGEGYAASCDALRDFDMRAELGRVAPPTLVIAGDDDPVGTPERSHELADGIPGARLETIAHARHMAAVEQPDAVTAALLEHLEGVTA